MKKLSATQQQVLDLLYKQIDQARNLSFEDWFIATECHGSRDAYNCRVKYNEVEWARKYYENYKVGNCLTHCNSRTLAALEKAGYIEVTYDSKGTHFGIDHVKVLNY